jgi:hypothetical protein
MRGDAASLPETIQDLIMITTLSKTRQLAKTNDAQYFDGS